MSNDGQRVSISAFLTREVSLDILRGLVIALMIIGNNLGGSNYYSILVHGYEYQSVYLVYNGLSLADIALPLFIFVVGVTIPFSFNRRIAKNESRRKMLIHIVSRTVILFGLGLLVSNFSPYVTLYNFRIMGVLQRIALCYLVASLALMFLFYKPKWRIFLAVIIPIVYTLILFSAPMTLAQSLSSQIDRAVLGSNHMYQASYDPEGLLTTFSSFGTVLFGLLVGEYLVSKKARFKVDLAIFSGLLVAVGLILNIWIPVNKGLYTTPYLLITSGISLGLLVVCYIIKNHAVTKSLTVLGLNAVVLYVGSELINSLLIFSGLKTIIFNSFFANTQNGSVLYSVCYLCVFWVVAGILYWRRIFIKV
jgi:predicted acyltransferase